MSLADTVAVHETNPTRLAIMAATVRLLLQRSSELISMADIAAEAGVSRRTVFNQFATKEAVIELALGQVWHRIGIAEITDAIDSVADPVATMTRIGHAITGFWLDGESIPVARMAIRESFAHPNITAQYIELGKRPVTQAIVRYITILARRGQLDVADADLAARQFIGLINEPLVFLQILGQAETHDPYHVRRVVDEAVLIFFLRYPLKR
ncbi:MAG: TetR/AcrR family transcriptional regulator [Mesorhizobium sp.]|nr:TetR/AcrR family transcriptional regulator [Mesorhizobium sp.]MCO5160224.1 TetR/AcrR family transcriptional regulator [Mesorhizobium sp.]